MGRVSATAGLQLAAKVATASTYSEPVSPLSHLQGGSHQHYSEGRMKKCPRTEPSPQGVTNFPGYYFSYTTHPTTSS